MKKSEEKVVLRVNEDKFLLAIHCLPGSFPDRVADRV